MIRANCRARFTAADFDFVVRALARSRQDNVSLVELLSDAETRDHVLDHPELVEAILSGTGNFAITSRRSWKLFPESAVCAPRLLPMNAAGNTSPTC